MKCSCSHNQNSTCIRRVPIFHSLTGEEMCEVSQIMRQISVVKGEQIYAMDDEVQSLFVVNAGRVKIYRLSDTGKEQVLRVLGSGDFMGELSLFSDAKMDHYAECIEDGTMCVIDGVLLRELMIKYPLIALKLLEEVSGRLAKTEQLLEDISLHSVERRLAQKLLRLSKDSDEVVLEMTKRDFASQMGMSQETLSRKLSWFQELNLIEQQGQRRILLKNREGLEGIVIGE
ncbi:MAG: Crp/Fnr family transcriptional regulator [Bacillota bacterium]|nr:Crp/Fnr family transcriptional regulator [Bacillota bacterium]